jgi:hypothetical protein
MSGSLYVDKFYVAQSEFEDIVFGRDLRDGMIVLLEDDILRADPGNLRSGYDRARADEINRWCEVTRLEVIAHPTTPLIRFVGCYPDGSMRVRTYGASYAWIVKRA